MSRIAEIDERCERLDVTWLRRQLLETMRSACTSNWVLSSTIVSLQAAWIAEECEPGMASVYVHNALLGPGCLPDQLDPEDRWLGFGESADAWARRQSARKDAWYGAAERAFNDAGLK